jgi:hypothetical protein
MPTIDYIGFDIHKKTISFCVKARDGTIRLFSGQHLGAKRHGTPEDYRAMATKLLPFTPQDVQLIQLGLARRTDVGAMASASSALKPTN